MSIPGSRVKVALLTTDTLHFCEDDANPAPQFGTAPMTVRWYEDRHPVARATSRVANGFPNTPPLQPLKLNFVLSRSG
jgi:hypothetical protein